MEDKKKREGITKMSLVLRRSPGQSFVIGQNAEIKITIFREENGVITIGVDAPKSVPINRSERFEKQLLNKADALAIS